MTTAGIANEIAVEGFFAILTKRRLKRGVFKGIADLQAAIKRYLAEHNQSPKPFIWTKDPEKIIAAVKRGHQTLDSIHYRASAKLMHDDLCATGKIVEVVGP